VIGLADDIAARAGAIDDRQGIGEAYDECRQQDRKLLHARRLWQWYAEKLGQRAVGDEMTAQTLKAADEIIWSCWKTAFTTMGAPVPAAPIAYVVPEFSASATPRTDPPAGLRPGADDLLRKHIERLPVPVVGLPPVCVRRPWWLIVAAHETGHHIQFETEGLEQRAQEAIAAAVCDTTASPSLARTWRKWSRELFADACSVLFTGPAAIWAVRELETRPAKALRESPSGTYPPPLVRFAVLDAVAEQAGFPATPPPGPANPGPAGPDDLRRHLACAPAVATALLDLTSPSGRELRYLGDQAVSAWSTADSGIAGWRAELLSADGPFPHPSLDAARLCAAAGVTAWEKLAAEAGEGDLQEPVLQESVRVLASRLRGVLPLCREPGTRAVPAVPDAAAIARRFAADLDAEGSGE
ncbi:MAG: hypothetical protein ACRDN0_33070, partial [Trebonia sp.]